MFQGLLELIINLWVFIRPWIILQPYERGARVRLGTIIKEIGPGVHLAVWFIDEFHVQNVMLQPQQWAEQSVTTIDGEQLVVSGSIEYEISDIIKYELKVQDPDESLMNRAQGAIAKFVAGHKYEDCTIEAVRRAVYTALRRNNACPAWGIRIKHVHIIDLAHHNVYRVMSAGSVSTLVIGDE